MAGITIGSNIAALQALRQLARTGNRLEGVYTRLASGQRINRAADDAAGLAVAMGLDAESRIFGQGIRNLNDGLSYVNIADGALSQLSALTTRQLELAQQAANGSFSTQQRKSLHAEANQLADEFNRIILSTRFNGLSVFNQSGAGTLALQAGFGFEGSLTIRQNSELNRSVGSGSFGAPTLLTATSSISALSGDFDNDGHLDIVNFTGSGSVEVQYGNGAGGFSSVVTLANGVSGGLRVADENEDGIDDILYSTGAAVMVARGSNSRAFSAVSTGVSGNGQFQVADLNGDGLLDIMGTQGLYFTVNLGKSDGTYAFAQQTTIIFAGNLQFGDFNGDGDDEFLFGNTIYQWTAAGVQTFGITTLAGPKVADFNNDGIADLFGTKAGGTYVALGRGDGTFGTEALVTNSFQSGSAEAVDINGDGRLDFLGIASGNIYTYLQNTDGTFSLGNSAAHGLGASTALGLFGDFDEDGALDIGINGESIGVYLLDGIATTSALAPQLNLLSADSARDALDVLREQLDRISGERGALGSFQSRIEAATRVLDAKTQNLKQAESRIRDADVAQEAADLVRTQIAQQAGAFVLGQAKLQPALALQLLQGIAPRR